MGTPSDDFKAEAMVIIAPCPDAEAWEDIIDWMAQYVDHLTPDDDDPRGGFDRMTMRDTVEVFTEFLHYITDVRGMIGLKDPELEAAIKDRVERMTDRLRLRVEVLKADRPHG